MSNRTFVGALLGQKVTPEIANKLDLVDQLAGQSIGSCVFYSNLDEIRERLEPWMPLFCLPFATEAFGVALHLRSADLGKGRLAIIRPNDFGEMIETANSIEQFVYRALLEEEGYGYGEGKMLRSFSESVSKANAVFGNQFFTEGRHGEFQRYETDELMIEVFGGTPYAFYSKAIYEEEPAGRFSILEKGIAVEPGCMALYVSAVETLIELDDRQRAAQLFARSLDCYHHTAYDSDLNEYFELGRSLLNEFPGSFSDDARWVLSESDPRSWARRAGELFNAGEVLRADKLLNDMCYGIRDYSGAVGAFRKHYEKLGWDWAVTLCDLRVR